MLRLFQREFKIFEFLTGKLCYHSRTNDCNQNPLKYIMEILKYLMKLNSVSLYWYNLKLTIFIIFSRPFHSTYTKWNLQLKTDYQSPFITRLNPEIINHKKISVTLLWLNLMVWCYRYKTSTSSTVKLPHW